MTTILVASVVGIITSFVGSMASFLIWVHWNLDEKWAARTELHRLRTIQRGLEMENDMRVARGLCPLPAKSD